MGVAYDSGAVRQFGPWDVVRLFERELNEGGNPIKFTPGSSGPKQLAHAKKLLRICKYYRGEVTAIIKEYCARDKTGVANWWVKNQPDLAQVVKQVDKLRARITVRQQQQEEDSSSWEDFEKRRCVL